VTPLLESSIHHQTATGLCRSLLVLATKPQANDQVREPVLK